MRTRHVTLALLVGLGVAFSAHAYSIRTTPAGFIARWTQPNITWVVNPVGSDNISNGSDITAIQSSFNDWQNLSCSKLTFTKAGNTSKSTNIATGEEPNGINEVVWVENSKWDYGQYVLGVTTPITYTNGNIIEADIAFNGYQVKWSTTGQFGRADVKSVAIHEIGHMFGLQHNLGGWPANNPPTMAPAADPYGKTASLETDDEWGACFLYPAGVTFPCANDAMCPFVLDTNPNNGEEFYTSKLYCNVDVCAFQDGAVGPSKTLGAACATQTECKSPYFCQPIQGGGGYCSQLCQPASPNCPSGFGCFGYSDGDGGACLPVDDEDPLKPEGDYCNSNDDCQTNLCYPSMNGTWQCRSSCQSNAHCVSGTECFAAPGYSTGGCLPLDLIPEWQVQDGDPCNNHDDCDSGICVLNPGTGGPKFCRAGCDPAIGGCGFGWQCIADGPTGGACVPEPASPDELGDEGAACNKGSECLTETCFGGVCARPCNVVSSSCHPDTEACQRITVDGVAGVCQSRGDLSRGAECTADPDCGNRFCDRVDGYPTKRCLVPCAIGSTGCGDGNFCSALPALTMLGACLTNNGLVVMPEVESDNPPATDNDPATTSGGVGPSVPGSNNRTESTCAHSSSPALPAAWLVLGGLGLLWLRRRVA